MSKISTGAKKLSNGIAKIASDMSYVLASIPCAPIGTGDTDMSFNIVKYINGQPQRFGAIKIGPKYKLTRSQPSQGAKLEGLSKDSAALRRDMSVLAKDMRQARARLLEEMKKRERGS